MRQLKYTLTEQEEAIIRHFKGVRYRYGISAKLIAICSGNENKRIHYSNIEKFRCRMSTDVQNEYQKVINLVERLIKEKGVYDKKLTKG